MSPVYHESAFGDAIVAALRERGWQQGSPELYEAGLGLCPRDLFGFIEDTQPEEWSELLAHYGGNSADTERGFVKSLDRAIADDGLLHVLRNGVKDRGVRVRVAYFKPNLVPPTSPSWTATAPTVSPSSVNCRTPPSRPTGGTASTWPCSSTASP
ncbi:hypothetical protein GCM10020256_08600 [Streptomyces thermocoprophilus]